ncbi:uncharacterized protein DUF4238 [Cellulophaga sp. RHA_52]|uniref:DUF4238 domain-containing protein n=1 Tax=Cellulophaga sp. RHA_52 TaxID=1250036 RepID=UPI001198E98D|nr:DUF4238 domain-containing protein [Cellulophaga sp. RHA_52]TVZ09765.1 uncharacterized protein DUF4238 [Cellulophaga sp. RHA_52]
MSVPRNHHYVSRVHQKKFFNSIDQKIYIYDKERANFYSKNTTKTLFSQRDLNTRLENETTDYKSLEEDLKINFEDDFNKNLLVLESYIKCLNIDEEVNNAIYFFAKYGVIGKLRTPSYKKNTHNLFKDAILEHFNQSTEEFKKLVNEKFSYKQISEYNNLVDYSKRSESIIELMGNLVFRIFIPKNENDYFILPDCTSITERERINNYNNPDIKEIASIGIPITSKIYLMIFSKKLYKENIEEAAITLITSDVVNEINEISYNMCFTKIVCINNDYLINFINHQKSKN